MFDSKYISSFINANTIYIAHQIHHQSTFYHRPDGQKLTANFSNILTLLMSRSNPA